MKQIYQTKFGAEDGNCLAACIACLFPVEIDAVPDFYAQAGALWHTAFERWAAQFGVRPFTAWADGGVIPIKNVYHFIGGNSPRGVMHSVVGFGGEMVFDPHPSGAGLVSVVDYTFFIKTFREE